MEYMDYDDKKLPHKHMTTKQAEKFIDFIFGDDLDFYEEHLLDLTDEQQEIFFEENPEFMSVFCISRDRMYLLKDRIYRGIMRKIKRYMEGDKDGCL